MTVTRNEFLTALSKPDAFKITVAEVANGYAQQLRYISKGIGKELDFGARSVTYGLDNLRRRLRKPS